jgi:molybdopterin-guanine dinucleotide biosynthesis protein A
MEENRILSDKPFGLVLAGGKSQRMGQDKGLLRYHDTTQRSLMYQMLQPFCEQVFISCRPEQVDQLEPNQAYILDEDRYQGPLNGILSAHHAYPKAAWLVVAVDLPFVSPQTLQMLLSQRDPQRVATAYATHASGKPEPLVAIWEASALGEAEAYLNSGQHCPRKFLSSQDIALVFPSNDLELYNANFPQEYRQAKEWIDKKT